MASTSKGLRSSLSHRSFDLFSGFHFRLCSPFFVQLPPLPLRGSAIFFARRRRGYDETITASAGKKTNKNQRKKNHGSDEEEEVDDAFEALFKQLEKDLKNDKSVQDIDDDFDEEDLAKLEKELEEALAEDEDLSDVLNLTVNEAEGGAFAGEESVDGKREHEEDEIDEEIEPPVKLKGWQLRRMAYALKKGRRKVNIKELAAEVCLDRSIVLDLLREPPSDLLLMSAALPEKPDKITVPENEPTDSHNAQSVPSEVTTESVKPETDSHTPIHVMQTGWTARKRLKKVHVETLEKVYGRTKRPTNSMISSIVLVTNLPRKRVVKWFEDKRAADGVPEQRRPYQRPASEPAYVRFSNIRAEVDTS